LHHNSQFVVRLCLVNDGWNVWFPGLRDHRNYHHRILSELVTLGNFGSVSFVGGLVS